MRICMIVGTDMSHDARVWKEAKTLVNAGHEVTVLAAWNSALIAEERSDGVHVVRVAPPARRRRRPPESPVSALIEGGTQSPTKRRRTPVALLREAIWYVRTLAAHVRIVANLKPDVVHIHDSDRLLIGIVIQAQRGLPIVYDAHEYLFGLLVDRSWTWKVTHRWQLLLERFLAPRAYAVITVSDEIGNKLARRYRIKPPIILYNFPPYQPPPAPSGLLRRALPAEFRSRPLLLHQGRLNAFRGYEQFLETLSYLPEAAGVLLGSGPSEPHLRDLARRLDLGSRVVFVPQVPWRDLGGFTADADLGFSISQDNCENSILALPNKLFEYLMAGVPVVASDYPELRRRIMQADVGILVPANDPREIAHRVGQLLKSPARLAEMRRNAVAASRATFNWEAQAERLTQLYSPNNFEIN